MNNLNDKPSRFPWTFFLLAFAISWVVWSVGIFSTQGWIDLPVPFLVFFFIGTWGPFVAACQQIYNAQGRDGLRQFLKRGFDTNFHWGWWLGVLLIPFLMAGVPVLIQALCGGATPTITLFSQPWMVIPIFLTYFITGGGNEEWGWRGYALDRLQERWTPLKASLVLGLIWGVWHTPLFFIESTGQYHMSLLIFVILTPGLSVLYTWVYNSSSKKLLAVWLLHAAMGTAWEMIPIVAPNVAGYEHLYIYDLLLFNVLAVLIIGVVGKNLSSS